MRKHKKLALIMVLTFMLSLFGGFAIAVDGEAEVVNPVVTTDPVEGEEAAPAEGEEAAPAEGEEAAPVEGEEAAPVEGEEAAPVEGEEAAPVEGEEAAPAEGEEAAPAEGEEAAPAEGEEAAPVEAEEPVAVPIAVDEVAPYDGAAITTGEGSDINIILDGAKIKMDSYPYIVNGRTMVPLRVISENLGYKVEWDENEYAVTISDASKKIVLTIGSTTAYVDGVAEALDVAAELSNDRTMVPVRFVAEAFGCTVNWNGESRTVIIVSNAQHTSGI